jgi:hypothetical protein
MMALLCFGDNRPLAETIWRGSWAVGTASIFSETFGRGAYPLPIPKMEIARRNKKRGLMNVMFYLDVSSFILSHFDKKLLSGEGCIKDFSYKPPILEAL